MDLLEIDEPNANDLWTVPELRTSGVFDLCDHLSTSGSSDYESLTNSDEAAPSPSLSPSPSESTKESDSSEAMGAKKRKGASTAEKKKKKSEPASASRKRKSPLSAGDSLTLSRDVLLTISSEEFEELVASVTATRRLTEAEHAEVRRQKRLIKNRESAALSRNRKKQAVETLESENAKLQQELTLYKRFLEQTNQLGAFASAMLAAPLGGSGAGGSSGRAGGAAGLLLVLVLSFGLFLSIGPTLPGSSLSSASDASMGGPQPNLRQLFSLQHQAHHMHEEAEHLSSSSSSSFSSSLLSGCNATVSGSVCDEYQQQMTVCP